MIYDLGGHYYRDSEKGYFYNELDNDIDVEYFDTLEECQDEVAYQESYSIQCGELRWESLCSW